MDSISLLTQTIAVLRKDMEQMAAEFNGVLGEIHTALTGMGRANSMALDVLSSRIRALESQNTQVTELPADTVDVRGGGKEL